jgi:hypothetical protein
MHNKKNQTLPQVPVYATDKKNVTDRREEKTEKEKPGKGRRV